MRAPLPQARMLRHLQALAPSGLSSLKLQRQKASEGWKVFTEPRHKCPETTSHLVSVPADFSVVQLAQNVVDTFKASWLNTLSGLREGKGFTKFFNNNTVPLAPSPLLFPLGPNHLAPYLPAFLFLLCTSLTHLICQSPSLPPSQTPKFPYSLVKIETLLIATRTLWAPEPWVKTQKFPCAKRDERILVINNKQLHHRRSRAIALSWTSFLYLFIIDLNWSCLPWPFYGMNVHGNLDQC